jgi:hypothetical protein
MLGGLAGDVQDAWLKGFAPNHEPELGREGWEFEVLSSGCLSSGCL